MLDQLIEQYPAADVLVLWDDSRGRYGSRDIKETVLARTPLRRKKAIALAAMPAVWRSVRLDDYERILVSSHAMAHQVGRVRDRRRANIFVYVHSPARYLWAPALDARGQGLWKQAAGVPLRAYDRKRAGDGAKFAANSEFVKKRILDSWGVPATVIHPPVDVPLLQSESDWRSRLDEGGRDLLQRLPRDYILGASRFVTYKRLEDVIAVGEAISSPVILAGGGPDEPRLRALAAEASVPVTIVPRPSAVVLRALMQEARAYVFPAVEDFGIMPVEAAALGTPVVVNERGGAAEVLALTGGGGAIDFSRRDSLAADVEQAIAAASPDAAVLTRRFSPQHFASNVSAWVEGGTRG